MQEDAGVRSIKQAGDLEREMTPLSPMETLADHSPTHLQEDALLPAQTGVKYDTS